MPNLVFIRHSQSQPDPTIPSSQWLLTAEGRRRCELLADLLIHYNLDIIVTSTGPKAIETGELTAQKLGIPCKIIKNLHEHKRETIPFFDTDEEFLEAVSSLFARPGELVLGEETGQEAQDRFAGAVESIMAAYPQENVAIVTHGTVLSLFASRYTGRAIQPFWQSLGMPAIIAFLYPEMELLAQINEIV